MLLLSSPWQAEFDVRAYSSGASTGPHGNYPAQQARGLMPRSGTGQEDAILIKTMSPVPKKRFGLSSSMALLPEIPGSPRGE